jgi:hypothetical protein
MPPVIQGLHKERLYIAAVDLRREADALGEVAASGVGVSRDRDRAVEVHIPRRGLQIVEERDVVVGASREV